MVTRHMRLRCNPPLALPAIGTRWTSRMAKHRIHFRFKFASLFALFLAAASARSQALSPAWVELGEDGKAVARIVVNNPRDCPAIQIDGASRPMLLRQPMPAGLRPV